MLRCVVCRTRRTTFSAMAAHSLLTGHHKPCVCSGYHHPHRPGSPCCDDAPYPTASRARAYGGSPEDELEGFIADALFGKNHKPTTSLEAPF